MRGTVARELRKMAKAVSTKPWFDGYVEATSFFAKRLGIKK